MSDPTNIGEILRRLLLVDDTQLAEAVKAQSETPGQKMGETLVKGGLVTEDQVHSALVLQARLRSRDIGRAARASEALLDRAFERALRTE